MVLLTDAGMVRQNEALHRNEGAILLFVVVVAVFMWRACVCCHSDARSPPPPAVSRFNRFKSTLSSSQLPSPLLSFSAFCHPKWYEKERRGGLGRKLIHILSQAISWVQMLLCSRPLE